MKPTLLFGAWGASWLLGALAGLGFAAGVLRDTRAGEPVLPIDLSRPSDWTELRFRPWRSGSSRVFVSTVSHDSTHLGALFAGSLDVLVRDGRGRVVWEGRYDEGEAGIALPWNYGDHVLAVLPVPASLLRPWSLSVRVPSGDPRFAGARSDIKLWRERPDPGMGGLANYVLIVPAGILLLASAVLGVSLAARGSRWPIALSLLALGCGLLLAGLSRA